MLCPNPGELCVMRSSHTPCRNGTRPACPSEFQEHVRAHHATSKSVGRPGGRASGLTGLVTVLGEREQCGRQVVEPGSLWLTTAGELPGRRFGDQWRFSRWARLAWLDGSDTPQRTPPGFGPASRAHAQGARDES